MLIWLCQLAVLWLEEVPDPRLHPPITHHHPHSSHETPSPPSRVLLRDDVVLYLQARAFVRQLLQAVAFMHDLTLVHTDLKPENVLFLDQELVTVTPPPGSK